MKDLPDPNRSPRAGEFDLDDFLHPAQAFRRPADVVSDPGLTVNEKRAILASWASDACAVEAVPALRRPPGMQWPVSVDEILEALGELDKEVQAATSSWTQRQVRRRARQAFWHRRGSGGQEPGPSIPH